MTPADRPRRPDAAVRRFVLVAFVVPAVLVAIGVAIQLALLPSVPSTIAVHWNATGEPDSFAPAWTQPLATIGFGLGIPALIALTALPGLRRGDRGSSYRLMGAIAAATSALMAGLLTWTMVIQAGPAGAQATLSLWAGLVWTGVAVLVGVGAWLLQPANAHERSAPASADPLSLGQNERAMWLRTTSMKRGPVAAIVAAVLIVVLVAIGAWYAGADPAVAWLLTIVAVVLVVFAATTLSFHVRVDDSGLHVDSALGLPRFRIPLVDVASAACVDVNPMGEFGGWGIRLGMDRRFGVVLRTGEAIEVTRRNGKRFVVTVDDAATGAGLLEALVARAARTDGTTPPRVDAG